MQKFVTATGHFWVALAVIAALAALVAVGRVSAAVAVPVIIAAGGVTIGGAIGSGASTKPPPG